MKFCRIAFMMLAAFSLASFQEITGFIYECGHEFQLLVKRTKLANPPQDSQQVSLRTRLHRVG